MRHDEQELLSVWDGWHWDDNKGGWLDPELCAKARREEVEHIRRHEMYTRVPREVCPRETENAPIKTRWAETDKGQPGKPKVRARWVAKEYKTHARPELCASSPPLESRKFVLSEIATGKRACGGCISTLRHEEGNSSNCHPRMTNACVGCCDTACTARVTPHNIGRRSWHRLSGISN